MNAKKYNENQAILFVFPNIPVGYVKRDKFGRRAGIFCGNYSFPVGQQKKEVLNRYSQYKEGTEKKQGRFETLPEK